jgi:PAS domain S-box-containing protein
MTRNAKPQVRLAAIVLAASLAEAAATVPIAIWLSDRPVIAVAVAIAVAAAIALTLAWYALRREREASSAAGALAAAEATTFDALIGVDEEGRVASRNEAAQALLASENGLVFDLAAEENAEASLRELLAVSENGRSRPRDVRLRKADGTTALFRVASTRIAGSQETLLAAAEIDELERSRRELGSARAKYDALVEQVPVVTYVHPPGRRDAPDYVSPQVSSLLGFGQDECAGRSLLLVDAIHPDDRARVVAEAAAAGDLGFRSEYRLVSRSGRIVPVADVAVTIRDPDNGAALTQGCLVDLSERTRAEEERDRFIARESALRDELGDRQGTLDLVNEATRLLSSPPETGIGLERVAALAARTFADWCVVDLVEEDGYARRVVTAHGEPRPPLDTDPPSDADDESRTVAKTRTPLLEPERISVPLLSRGRALGVMTFLATSPRRPYGTADLALAEHLGRVAGLAVDTGRLYRHVQESTEATRALAYVADGVLLIDQDGLVRLWNHAAETIIGVGSEEVLGRRAVDVIPGWRTLVDQIPVAAAPDPGTAATLPIETEEGERWISISGVQFFGGTVYAFRDVTAAHRLDELKAEFVSTASHELRTPLAAVYGAAQTLRRHDFALDESGRERFITLIVEEADRLSRIVNEILLANQLDDSRLDLVKETFDPADLVERVAESARTRAPAGVRIVVNVPDSVPAVAADRDKARQVLVNLVENAMKYSPDGGTVELRVEPDETSVNFSVRDNGLGIPPEEQARIFDKFYRLDPDMTRGVGGTGLGLYICRELVERMDGHISVESEPGEGSTFTFDLPRAETSAPRAAAEAISSTSVS